MAFTVEKMNIPKADIPVVQVFINPGLEMAQEFKQDHS